MKKKSRPQLAVHPKYGDQSKPSGCNYTREEVREMLGWKFGGCEIFPDSAIPADREKQNFTVMPMLAYVDALLTCEACQKRFIFFAREQKYWYEDLQFDLMAEPLRCTDCRFEMREVKRAFASFSELIVTLEERSIVGEEKIQLAKDTELIASYGLIKKADRIRRVANALEGLELPEQSRLIERLRDIADRVCN